MSTPSAAYQTEKFRLTATPGTADGFPVTFDEESWFLNSSGGRLPLPWGHYLEEGWQGSGVVWAVGDEWQAVPDSLQVRWFSFAEDKFYDGHFLLPQKHLYDLLKQGLWNEHKQQQITYDDLTVVVAPAGLVAVWLTAGSSDRVLVGRYHAHEINYDYDNIRPGDDRAADVREARSSLPAAVQEEIRRGPISGQHWDDYLRTYPWHFSFSQPVALSNYDIKYVDAEATGSPVSPDLPAYVQAMFKPDLKPVPAEMNLYLAGAHGRKRLLRVDPFDEAETMAAFQALHAKYPAEVLTLHVELNERLTQASLTLQAGGQSVPLSKSTVQFFDPE